MDIILVPYTIICRLSIATGPVCAIIKVTLHCSQFGFQNLSKYVSGLMRRGHFARSAILKTPDR